MDRFSWLRLLWNVNRRRKEPRMLIIETSGLLYWDRNGLRGLWLCKLDDDDDDDHDDGDDRQHVKLKKASPRRNECSLFRSYNCLHNTRTVHNKCAASDVCQFQRSNADCWHHLLLVTCEINLRPYGLYIRHSLSNQWTRRMRRTCINNNSGKFNLLSADVTEQVPIIKLTQRDK